jgi:hypothetical protein
MYGIRATQPYLTTVLLTRFVLVDVFYMSDLCLKG